MEHTNTVTLRPLETIHTAATRMVLLFLSAFLFGPLICLCGTVTMYVLRAPTWKGGLALIYAAAYAAWVVRQVIRSIPIFGHDVVRWGPGGIECTHHRFGFSRRISIERGELKDVSVSETDFALAVMTPEQTISLSLMGTLEERVRLAEQIAAALDLRPRHAQRGTGPIELVDGFIYDVGPSGTVRVLPSVGQRNLGAFTALFFSHIFVTAALSWVASTRRLPFIGAMLFLFAPLIAVLAQKTFMKLVSREPIRVLRGGRLDELQGQRRTEHRVASVELKGPNDDTYTVIAVAEDGDINLFSSSERPKLAQVAAFAAKHLDVSLHLPEAWSDQ